MVAEGAPTPLKPGEPAPEFTLPRADGRAPSPSTTFVGGRYYSHSCVEFSAHSAGVISFS